MLLRRCAWCGRWMGVKWGGLRVDVSHGMCRRCFGSAMARLEAKAAQ